jgi:hypothetical protein
MFKTHGYQPLGDECPRPEAVYYRALPDDYEVCVYRMMLGNWRVCYGEQGAWGGIVRAFCYRDPELAIRAASEWNGEGDPLLGWHRDIMGNRARPDGDPEREEIGGRPRRSAAQ